MARHLQEDPSSGWLRGALLVAFAGGLAGGWALHVGLTGTWETAIFVLLGVSGAMLVVGNLLINQTLASEGRHIPLPGEIYGDRKAPDPKDMENPSLNGRIPFKVGKDVVKRDIDPRVAKLYDELDALNSQLQRANVKLGLGELSNDGYQRVVKELKQRRAEVEHRITQVEMVLGDKS